MNSSPDEVYAAIRDTDPDVLDGDGLDDYTRLVARLMAWCEARHVRATRRRRNLAAEGRAADAESALANHGRQSARDAKAAADRERVCTEMPAFEDAIESGAVSAGHLDALATATKGLDDGERAEFIAEADTLLEHATAHSVDAFGRSCRDLAKGIASMNNSRADVDELERQRSMSKISRWVDRQTGMHKTLIEADPVTDREIWSAIQASRKHLRRRQQQQQGAQRSGATFDRLTVDALVAAVSGPSGIGTRPPGIVVHVDLITLTDGRHPGSLCETDSGVALPVDTVRRLACDAGIVPMVLDGAGVVLDEGRAKRLATDEQRMALAAMQSTCSEPMCTVSIDECIIHHLDPWARGGRTDIEQMAPLCETHHHLVHEGGWAFTMTPDRLGTWTRPDGTQYWSGTLLDRQPVTV
jgi:hypothetical protein